MDIVHLIETQMNKSVQEQTSRTYAEIEKTLDHSEGSYLSSNSTIKLLERLHTQNQCIITITYLYSSVSSSVFSARGCRKPESCETGGVRPETTSCCFRRGSFSCFPTGHSFLGRTCWSLSLRECAWRPVG